MTDRRTRAARALAGRDVLVVYGALLAVLVLSVVATGPIRAPGSLLFVAFDALQRWLLPGVTGTVFDLVFAAFLYLLSVVGAWLWRSLLAPVVAGRAAENQRPFR